LSADALSVAQAFHEQQADEGANSFDAIDTRRLLALVLLCDAAHCQHARRPRFEQQPL
jgi:hypothetical protein